MGGSHPAYEYTVMALRAGKNVITSNKEVVANFGDEFIDIANEMGVCYRFEASVGGGIPVISPMISCIRQNRITEVRGILNGTTNYILTKMFSFGESFSSALSDAQSKGFAEKDPTADIEGIDATRKIAILAALATGCLVPTDDIYREGITAIRADDVANAAKAGYSIKLLGRCKIEDDGAYIMVAPFMIPSDMPLATINGVYNAVEVIGEPIESVMFYGPGAGAGATASAVVGDLMEIMRTGTNYAVPEMKKSVGTVKGYDSFVCRHYISISGIGEDDISAAFGAVQFISGGDECTFITDMMSEGAVKTMLKLIKGEVKSRIRVLAK